MSIVRPILPEGQYIGAEAATQSRGKQHTGLAWGQFFSHVTAFVEDLLLKLLYRDPSDGLNIDILRFKVYIRTILTQLPKGQHV